MLHSQQSTTRHYAHTENQNNFLFDCKILGKSILDSSTFQTLFCISVKCSNTSQQQESREKSSQVQKLYADFSKSSDNWGSNPFQIIFGDKKKGNTSGVSLSQLNAYILPDKNESIMSDIYTHLSLIREISVFYQTLKLIKIDIHSYDHYILSKCIQYLTCH